MKEPLTMELDGIFQRLDEWITEQNLEARREGMLGIQECEFKIVGQAGLLQGGLASLELSATADLDAYTTAAYAVQQQLGVILEQNGLSLDPLGNDVWMPEETEYVERFDGSYVKVLVALPEYILISKAVKAPAKNKKLLRDYLALGPSDLFLNLVDIYVIDLNQFLD